MSDRHGKGLPALPKIKRQTNKGGLRNVENTSRDAQEVKLTIERSNLDRTFTSPWTPETIQMVVNKELEAQYREKKAVMKGESRGARELQDHFAFLLVKDPSIMTKIAQEGVKTKAIAFNALGDSKLGIYVCKHADVQLKLAETWRVDKCHLIVCKVIYGKCKMVTPQCQTGGSIEPTPNFDCHVSQEKPNANDPLDQQITKSMVYLYEYNEDYEPVDRPKHCVPYAFVVYNKSKNVKPSGDTKSVQWTTKSKPQTSSRPISSGNEARRKSNREAFEKRVAGGFYPAPQFPHLYIPPVDNRVAGQKGLLPIPGQTSEYSVLQTRQDPRIRSTRENSDDKLQENQSGFAKVDSKPTELLSLSGETFPDNKEPTDTFLEETDPVPYSPGKNHDELEESSESIPTPERELEESIIKASFRKDLKPDSAEKDEVDLAMLNANSEQLEAVVKHLEAVLLKKQEELRKGNASQHKTLEHGDVLHAGDLDERSVSVISNVKNSFVVNEMGDTDERLRPNTLVQNSSWNANFENAFGFDPRQIPFLKHTTNTLTAKGPINNQSCDIIKEVPMDIDSDSENSSMKAVVDSVSETTEESNQKGKPGRKVSLSDYKARKLQTSSISPRLNDLIETTESFNDRGSQIQEIVHQPPTTVTTQYSQYLTEEQGNSFQISYQQESKQFSEVTLSQTTRNITSKSGLYHKTHHGMNNTLNSPTRGLSPGSAGNSHVDGIFLKSPSGLSPETPTNQPFGSILQKVNIDISNIKNILQNITSPTPSPSTSPIKNIWTSAHEDVPWMQLKEVKRQLSYEEQQAELRYDAYSLTTSKAEKSLEDEDDTDFTSLISKIKNLQQEIDQIKKDEKTKTPEWPSPLIAAKEIVDKKIENSKCEQATVSRGANLLQDLSSFHKESVKIGESPDDVIDLSSDYVNIPGLGFSDKSEELSIKDSSVDTNTHHKVMLDSVNLSDVGAEIPTKKTEKNEIVQSLDDRDSDDNCLVICDQSQSRENELQKKEKHGVLAGSNTEALTDDKTHENIKLCEEVKCHIFSTPVAMSTPTKRSKISEVESSDNENEIGYISCEVSFTTESDISPEKHQHMTTNERAQSILSDVPCRMNLDGNVQNPKGASSKSSSPTLADNSVRTSSTDTSEETKKKAQKAKMKAYLLKKKRGMLGYSKKRKKKKKHTEMDDLVSTTSSDLLDISESLSVDRFSGAMSSITRASSLPENAQRLRTLLTDLGIKHWSDGLKVKELQPVVYLRRCDDPLSVSSGSILTRKSLETQSSEILPDVDSRFPCHNDERVKQWIEGTRKKIKITLKDQQIDDVKRLQEGSKQEAVQNGAPDTSSTDPIKGRADPSLMKSKTIPLVKENCLQSIDIKPEPFSQENHVSISARIVESKPYQEFRNISPITVICSKPAMIASSKTRVPSPHCYPQTTRSFIPITIATVSNTQPCQQAGVTKQDAFTPQNERLSASISPLLPLPSRVNSESVPRHQTPQVPPLNLNPSMPQSSGQADRSSKTINPVAVVQQRQSVSKSLIQTGKVPLLPSPVSNPSTVIVKTTSFDSKSVGKQIPALGSMNTFTPYPRVSVRPKLIQVPATYGNNSNFPPPYRYTTVSSLSFPNQMIQTPVTQSLYYGQNHPTQSQVNSQLQPSLYPNQPHLHGSGFPSRQEVSLSADNQGVNNTSAVRCISAPLPQPVLSQPIQSLPPYPSASFDKPPLTTSSTLIDTNYESVGVKRKTTDVMDWFADKFVPKRHVKESVLNSFSDTDSRSSQRSRSPFSDSYTESSVPSSPHKKKSQSFLVYGCQPHGAGTNETNTQANTQYENSFNENNSFEKPRMTIQEENKEEKPHPFSDVQNSLKKNENFLKDSMSCRATDPDSPVNSAKESNKKQMSGFKNTFVLVKGKEDSQGNEIKLPASVSRNDVSSTVLETPASPEQETPASPDHVSVIPSFEIIDVSDSPERHVDDSDGFDTSIDGLARQRDLIRKELDDLRSNSGSPQVSKKVQIKSNDLIEISDEEIEEGELTDDGIEGKKLKSHFQSIDHRVIAFNEKDDTKVQNQKKYLSNTSVTVRKEDNPLVAKGESSINQFQNKDKNEKITGDREANEHNTDIKMSLVKNQGKYRFMGTDGHSYRQSRYMSSRFRSRSRSRSSSSETKFRSNRHKTTKRYISDDRSSSSDRQYKSRDRSSSSERRYKPQGRDKWKSSRERRKSSRERSPSRERWHKSRGRSVSRERYYRSRRRSSSRDGRYRSSGRSFSKDHRYKSHGRSSSRDRRFRSRGRSSSNDRCRRSRERSSSCDKQNKSSSQRKDTYQKSTNRFVFTDNSREVKTNNTETKAANYAQDTISGNECSESTIPYQRQFSTSTAANAWSEMLQQKPTNVEIIGGEKATKDTKTLNQVNLDVHQELKDYIAHRKIDEKTNVSEDSRDNIAEEQSRELKGYVQTIKDATSAETLKSWAIKEFKFHSETEFDKIVPKVTVDLDLKISPLNKNQRKSLKAKLRKEVETVMENSRIEQINANQTFPVSASESIVKDDQNALEIRAFAPLNITKILIEKELEIVREHLQKVWSTSQLPTGARSGSSGTPALSKGSYWFSLRQDMQQIETELMQRITTYGVHYGVPNRRVPNDLLTEEEKNSHFSEENLVLVLTGYIPPRAFQKLSSLREKLENAKKDIANANGSEDRELLQILKIGKEEIHRARKAVMLSFTGPLSKKRIQKIKTKAKGYRNCMEYFKKNLGEFKAEHHFRYLMMSLQDLDRHYSLLTQLLDEQEKQKQTEITRDIHLKKRRDMVDKFHDNFKLVDNQLNTMRAEYHDYPPVCAAITHVSNKIREALTLINAEKNSKNISINTVAQLEEILKSCLSGYENVKQQIPKRLENSK